MMAYPRRRGGKPGTGQGGGLGLVQGMEKGFQVEARQSRKTEAAKAFLVVELSESMSRLCAKEIKTMSENVENLILEHLRGIHSSIEKLTVSVDESRMRISSLEGHVAGLRRDFSLIHDDIAAIQVRLDHQEDRLSRIEKRLELTAA